MCWHELPSTIASLQEQTYYNWYTVDVSPVNRLSDCFKRTIDPALLVLLTLYVTSHVTVNAKRMSNWTSFSHQYSHSQYDYRDADSLSALTLLCYSLVGQTFFLLMVNPRQYLLPLGILRLLLLLLFTESKQNVGALPPPSVRKYE